MAEEKATDLISSIDTDSAHSNSAKQHIAAFNVMVAFMKAALKRSANHFHLNAETDSLRTYADLIQKTMPSKN